MAPHPWGCSSVGRAPALQAGGQEFESLHLHLIIQTVKRTKFSVFLTTPQPEHSENKFSSFRIFFEYPVWLVWPALFEQARKSFPANLAAAL